MQDQPTRLAPSAQSATFGWKLTSSPVMLLLVQVRLTRGSNIYSDEITHRNLSFQHGALQLTYDADPDHREHMERVVAHGPR